MKRSFPTFLLVVTAKLLLRFTLTATIAMPLPSEAENTATSADGRYRMVVNDLSSLTILNTHDLSPIKVISIPTRSTGSNKSSEEIISIYTAPARQSFIVTIGDIAEVWEISYKDDPLPVYNGLMHDYRLGEGVAMESARFPISRIRLENCHPPCFDNLTIYPPSGLLIRYAEKKIHVLQMDARREIAKIDSEDIPDLASSIILNDSNNLILATPYKNKSKISFIDMNSWKIIKYLRTKGSIDLMSSSRNSRFIWTSVTLESGKPLLQVIDKSTLKIVKQSPQLSTKQY